MHKMCTKCDVKCKTCYGNSYLDCFECSDGYKDCNINKGCVVDSTICIP